jgi:hypothetical protein
MQDELNFKNGNNASISLRIVAERLRVGDASIIIARDRGDGVLEIKVMMKDFRIGPAPTIP